MQMRKIFIIALLLQCSIAMLAVPASHRPRQVTLANGSSITAYMHGDEFYHYLADTEGNILLPNDDGTYSIADQQAAANYKRTKANNPKNKARRAKRISQFINHAPRGLVILVNFPNSTSSYKNGSLNTFSNTRQDFDNMLNNSSYKVNFNYTDYYGKSQTINVSGCARDYFEEQSYGAYKPQFDVKGIYTLKYPSSYYAGSDGTDRAEEMIIEACQMADKDGVDFSKYDNDGDGEVDFVFVFYAGYGQADSDETATIWPHMWWLSDLNKTITLDGKKVNMYACASEMCYTTNKMEGIATFCHEFSHVMGLPDLYDTDYNYPTVGNWDIMDDGTYNNEGYTPPAYSAYERFYAGWITPTIINADGQYTLDELNRSRQAYLIAENGTHNLSGESPNPKTFYLLENRQQIKGTYDEYLPGHGMLVTKVQYNAKEWEDNTLNNHPVANQGIALVCANGKMGSEIYDGYVFTITDPKNAYPAGSNKCKTFSAYPINNIAESNQLITFDIGNNSGGNIGSCVDYSYTITNSSVEKGLEIGDNQLDDYLWTVTTTGDGKIEQYDNERGAHFGSNSKTLTQLSISTDNTANCLISSVTINAARNSKDHKEKLAIYIGGQQVDNEEAISATSTDYTFTNSKNLVGDLEIRFTSSGGIFYIKSINIEYETPTANSILEENHLNISSDKGVLNLYSAQPASCSIYNLQGQLVYSVDLHGTAAISLPMGIYMVRSSINNIEKTEKVLVW